MSIIPKIPGFIISEKIGSGNNADVYKATKQADSNNIVAIKCIRKSGLSKTAVDNLISEIRILKTLDHMNIVKLNDFTWNENYIFIIMEYCSGGDLSKFIQRRRCLPEEICQRFLQQLASALKYMRDKNISHFDLKPQNILLASRHTPILKIADFGLAQQLTSSDTLNTLKGSPLYMAPEIVLQHQYDARADIWSVGVILYECLFGKAPYSSKDINELIFKIKSDTPIIIPDITKISINCRHLVQSCLQRNLEKRIDFDSFFSHSFIDLEHCPSSTSITKGEHLIATAIELQNNGLHKNALDAYNDGLQYMVPMLYVEVDSVKRGALRKKIQSYTKHLDKESLGANAKFTIKDNDLQKICIKDENIEELINLSKTTPNLLTGIEIILTAKQYEREGKYSSAMEYYELALGKLIPILKLEPKGRRRDLLHHGINDWLHAAEHLKTEQDDELQTGDSTNEKTCCVQ